MTNTPLYGPDFGSYPADDVAWLLSDLSHASLEEDAATRERDMQSGKRPYYESLPVEYQPTETYMSLYRELLDENAGSVADAVARTAQAIRANRGDDVVLVSLARAGTPVGVLLRRYARSALGLDWAHYTVSIVRGGGIDVNAMNYIVERHGAEPIMFIDGWTGKGAIAYELDAALAAYTQQSGITIPNDLAVLADPAHSVGIYGTRADLLIPSSCLNSTVSGLVSRTVYNKALIGESDFHGAKFYSELADADVSNGYIDAVSAFFPAEAPEVHADAEKPSWSGWKAVEAIGEAYGIANINLIKPGIGEATRVLLRRVPWKILQSADADASSIRHILELARDRNVPVEIVEPMPYAVVGLIRPEDQDA